MLEIPRAPNLLLCEVGYLRARDSEHAMTVSSARPSKTAKKPCTSNLHNLRESTVSEREILSLGGNLLHKVRDSEHEGFREIRS